jgi:hypothetical protein
VPCIPAHRARPRHEAVRGRELRAEVGPWLPSLRGRGGKGSACAAAPFCRARTGPAPHAGRVRHRIAMQVAAGGRGAAEPGNSPEIARPSREAGAVFCAGLVRPPFPRLGPRPGCGFDVCRRACN